MKKIEKELKLYYDEKLKNFGAGAKGVGWKSPEAQRIRFEQIIKITNGNSAFSINDLGCGVGDFLDFLIEKKYDFTVYNGYDELESMIEIASQKHPPCPKAHFCTIKSLSKDLKKADYTVASGIFSLKYRIPDYEWLCYILETIHYMSLNSNRGFAFNMLTKYSDPEYMDADLYYGDPLFLFDHCKRNYSRNVALLHDYNEYDFTILVKK